MSNVKNPGELTLHAEYKLTNYDGDDLGDVLLDMAARQLVQKIGQYRRGDDPDTEVFTEFRKRVREITDDEIRERVVPMVEEAITGSVTPTNKYGEACGEPQTLTSYIVELARTQITTAKSDGYNRPKETLLDKIIKAEVGRVFEGEIRKEIEAQKTKARQAVAESAADVLAQAMKTARL